MCAWVCVCVPCGRGLRAVGVLCVPRDSTCEPFPCRVIGGGRWDRQPQGSISQRIKLRLQGHGAVRGAVGIQTEVYGTHQGPCSVPSTHLLLKCFSLENKGSLSHQKGLKPGLTQHISSDCKCLQPRDISVVCLSTHPSLHPSFLPSILYNPSTHPSTLPSICPSTSNVFLRVVMKSADSGAGLSEV